MSKIYHLVGLYWKYFSTRCWPYNSPIIDILLKDAAGNVSESVWDNVVITTVSDQTAPVVISFQIPTESEHLTVPIRSFQATDSVGVTGYMITTSSTKPSASSTNWRATPPTTYTFTSIGTKRLYPWAKDAAGNVSALWNGNATVVISNDD